MILRNKPPDGPTALKRDKRKKAKKGIDSGKKFIEEIAVFTWLFQTGLIARPVNWRHSGKRITEAFEAKYPDAVCLSDQKSMELMRQAGAEMFFCWRRWALPGVMEINVIWGTEPDRKILRCSCLPAEAQVHPKEVGHTHSGLMMYFVYLCFRIPLDSRGDLSDQRKFISFVCFSIILSLLIGSVQPFF